MKTNTMKNSLLLFLTAAIWGVAFVAQSVGMDYVGPFTFNAVRFLLGGTVLIPVLLWKKKNGNFEKTEENGRGGETSGDGRRTMFVGGICCGCALSIASLLQQLGIQYTTVAKAGFITALYIIIVPILGVFFHKKVRSLVWLAVVLAVFGMYLLCIKGSFSIGKGDVLVLLCAAAFSVHILVVDYFSPKADGVALSCIQFYTSSVICGIGMFLLETPSFQAILSGWIPVLYAGVMSCGVAYTLQIIGQKGMDPTVASLILSLESVVSLIAGWILLGQALNAREICGCILVFAAIILAQLPEKKHVKL
ncbi:MAG: DMT family transporter [Lachnospiraceae bacterium]|nr:DMT family transporter [Lachnospiraceae bacterium]